jgi:hypothetical protein
MSRPVFPTCPDCHAGEVIAGVCQACQRRHRVLCVPWSGEVAGEYYARIPDVYSVQSLDGLYAACVAAGVKAQVLALFSGGYNTTYYLPRTLPPELARALAQEIPAAQWPGEIGADRVRHP